MGQSTWGVLRKQSASNMIYQALLLTLSLACLSMGQNTHNLPVLFKYEEPTHSVAVFRGAQLKQAIAAGLVPGFGNLWSRQARRLIVLLRIWLLLRQPLTQKQELKKEQELKQQQEPELKLKQEQELKQKQEQELKLRREQEQQLLQDLLS